MGETSGKGSVAHLKCATPIGVASRLPFFSASQPFINLCRFPMLPQALCRLIFNYLRLVFNQLAHNVLIVNVLWTGKQALLYLKIWSIGLKKTDNHRTNSGTGDWKGKFVK